MKRKERKRSKTQEKEVMHSKVAHHPLTDARPVPKQPSAPHGQLPPVSVLGMTFLGVENPLGQVGSAVLAVLPLSSLCSCPLPEQEDPTRPWLQVSAAQHRPGRRCGGSVILITPKCSPAPAARKKIASVPAETRTALQPHC